VTQEQLKALYEAEEKKQQAASARYLQTYSLADCLACERAIGHGAGAMVRQHDPYDVAALDG